MDIHPPLIDLLGGRWQFEAPVTAAAWGPDGLVAAFGLGDGTVVLARARWPGGPEVRARASGGLEVIPPTVPSPPVSRVAAHKGACRVLVAARGGFLSLGADGSVLRIGANGHSERDAGLAESRVELLAIGDAGWCAGAAGRRLILTGPSRTILTLPREVSAMAFDRTGRQCAVAYQDGVDVWSVDGALLHRGRFQGVPRALAWSPDGAWLALAPDVGELRIWRLVDGLEFVPCGQTNRVGSLGFSSDGLLLAASGAPRVKYWRLDPLALDLPGACGLPSNRAPVCTVALHPTRTLVAAGYESGVVLLCRPGSDDVLFAKGPGGGATSAIAWSADGEKVAIATEGGEAGVVLLPNSLFRGVAD